MGTEGDWGGGGGLRTRRTGGGGGGGANEARAGPDLRLVISAKHSVFRELDAPYMVQHAGHRPDHVDAGSCASGHSIYRGPRRTTSLLI